MNCTFCIIRRQFSPNMPSRFRHFILLTRIINGLYLDGRPSINPHRLVHLDAHFVHPCLCQHPDF
jgi:hypothetical protein